MILLKVKSDGRYKARIVACGNYQKSAIAEHHATVAAQEDWMTLIVTALRPGWKVASIDIKTAFLQTDPAISQTGQSRTF